MCVSRGSETLNEMQVKTFLGVSVRSRRYSESENESEVNRWTNIIYNLNFSENVGAIINKETRTSC